MRQAQVPEHAVMEAFRLLASPRQPPRDRAFAVAEDARRRDIPVVFLTVSKSLDERAKPLRAGHLVKPVTADDLLRTVAEYTRARPAAGGD